ncbi:MAG: (d)CMP kinase [Firmicutes bacterium]|nr:(d)CMP kinase [Bacillota bacterium]
MEKIFQIAVDGPSGAGKSTVAKAVAKKLNIEYIDTGAMYRAFGLKLLEMNVDFGDEEAVRDALAQTEVDIKDGEIILDGRVVSHLIRTPEVSMAASKCSAYPFVREKMVKAQQKMGESRSIIMDGRDICAVVFPQAEYKYFITASDEERASRRYKELIEKGEKTTYEETLKAVRERDHNDMTRAASPLCKAEDAEEIDTSGMSIEQVRDYICSKVREK